MHAHLMTHEIRGIYSFIPFAVKFSGVCGPLILENMFKKSNDPLVNNGRPANHGIYSRDLLKGSS